MNNKPAFQIILSTLLDNSKHKKYKILYSDHLLLSTINNNILFRKIVQTKLIPI